MELVRGDEERMMKMKMFKYNLAIEFVDQARRSVKCPRDGQEADVKQHPTCTLDLFLWCPSSIRNLLTNHQQNTPATMSDDDDFMMDVSPSPFSPSPSLIKPRSPLQDAGDDDDYDFEYEDDGDADDAMDDGDNDVENQYYLAKGEPASSV